MTGQEHPWIGQEYPPRTGQGTPHRQDMGPAGQNMPWTGYTAGITPLALTQKDFIICIFYMNKSVACSALLVSVHKRIKGAFPQTPHTPFYSCKYFLFLGGSLNRRGNAAPFVVLFCYHLNVLVPILRK